MEGVFMMVRKLLKAAIYVKVIVVTTLVTMQEPMADEVMDEFVTSEIMEEETLAEDTEPFEEETNEELNMIATNEEENLNDVIDDTDFQNVMEKMEIAFSNLNQFVQMDGNWMRQDIIMYQTKIE